MSTVYECSEFCKFRIPMMVTALKWKINADSDSHHTVRDSGEGGEKKKSTSQSSWKPATSHSSADASEFRHCDIRQRLFHDNVTVTVLVSQFRCVAPCQRCLFWLPGASTHHFSPSISTNKETPSSCRTKLLLQQTL